MNIYGATDIGTRRKTNQDTFINTVLGKNAVLSVVCDGMGGANAGNIASTIAASTVTDYIKRSFVPALSSSSAKNLLCSAIDTANSEIYDKAQSEPELSGMGTTIVASLVIENTAYIAHVGDSRAYLIDKDKAEQITRDHSVIQTLIENGHLTADEAKHHPERNVITRALGIMDSVDCDFVQVNLKEELLLLCTDGVSNVVNCEMFKKVFSETSIENAPKWLIDTANALNSGDNVTACVISLN